MWRVVNWVKFERWQIEGGNLSKPRVNIHRLKPDEWKRLRRLRLKALMDAPNAFGSTLERAMGYSAENWYRQIEELVTFVAAIEGSDVGMARGAPDESDPKTAFLLSMWVTPEARGQAVGNQLVQAVAEWAQTMGFTQLVLDVADDNEPAIALYERMNFRPTGESGTLPPPRTHILEHRRALTL